MLNVELHFTQGISSLKLMDPLKLRYDAFFLLMCLFSFGYVFHLNVLKGDNIFSACLYLMPAFRMTARNAEDKINWTCTIVYKFSSRWVSSLLDKHSTNSLNWVICSLNGLTYPYKSRSLSTCLFCPVHHCEGETKNPVFVCHIKFDSSSWACVGIC